MTERCQHNNPAATCCACLTEKFARWEAAAKKRREESRAVRLGIQSYHSKELGLVTIPE